MSGFSFKAAIVTGLIGLTAVFASGANAQAASPVANSATNHGYSADASLMTVNHRQGHSERQHNMHRPNNMQRPHNMNRPHNNNRFACSPREAASKASRMGIRNARVSTNRSTIRVSGIRHGRPTSVMFGKARGCPVLR